MIILKVTKKSGFHPPFRRYVFRKTTGGGQIDPPYPTPPHPHPSRFRVKQTNTYFIIICEEKLRQDVFYP